MPNGPDPLDVLPGLVYHGPVYEHDDLGQWLAGRFRMEPGDGNAYCDECDGPWPVEHADWCPVGKVIALAVADVARFS